MPCRRCGDEDPKHRNGRCQNVPASEHDWYEEGEPVTAVDVHSTLSLDQMTTGPTITLRAPVLMRGGEPQAVTRIAPEWVLIVDPMRGLDPPFAVALLWSPPPEPRHEVARSKFLVPVYIGTAERTN